MYQDIPAATVAERFEWLGGIIRLLLNDPRKAEKIVKDAASSANITTLVSAVVSSAFEANFSHVLGHFTVSGAYCCSYVCEVHNW